MALRMPEIGLLLKFTPRTKQNNNRAVREGERGGSEPAFSLLLHSSMRPPSCLLPVAIKIEAAKEAASSDLVFVISNNSSL
jgi:hypothetical protein